jgi:hypothetical protein
MACSVEVDNLQVATVLARLADLTGDGGDLFRAYLVVFGLLVYSSILP